MLAFPRLEREGQSYYTTQVVETGVYNVWAYYPATSHLVVGDGLDCTAGGIVAARR